MRNSSSQLETYFKTLTLGSDSLLAKARTEAERLGLGHISLGSMELQILKYLVSLHKSKNFVEIGTLTGASGLGILAGLPEGAKLWTIEKEPRHAAAAEPILLEAAKARHQHVRVVVGDAREKLNEISKEGPFDGIFIDGNKAAYGDYLKWAEVNLIKGGLIIADNVLLSGTVYGEQSERFSEKQIQVMKDFNKRLFDPNLFQSCLIPTTDGLLAAVKIF